MEKQKRVILINENILTEDLAEVKIILEDSVKTIKSTREGIEVEDLKNAIKDIQDVCYVLDCLSYKKFPEASIELEFLKKD